MIFACFWTVKIVITSNKLVPDLEKQLILQTYDDADEETKIQIIKGADRLNLYGNRLDLYLRETNKMNLENYSYLPILDKLYLAPLSSSLKIVSKPDPIEYLRLVSVFSIGLKKYDELFRKILLSLEESS